MGTGVSALVAVLFAFMAAPAGAEGPATSSTATATTATAAAITGAAPEYAPVAAAQLSPNCAAAGAIAIVAPGAATLTVGAAPGSLGASAYPAAAPVVSFEGVDVAGSACRPGGVSVRSLSLFGGAVTAAAVSASDGRGSVSDLRVDGNPVELGPGESVPVEAWGLLIAADQVGAMLRAPLALHLLEPRDQLPAGTVVLVGFGATPAPAAAAKPEATTKLRAVVGPALPRQVLVPERPAPSARPAAATAHTRKHERHKAKKHQPLKVTPRLGLPHYDFPVARGADWGDTYGGVRSDIADGWHHGDDLFAPLGTPVVAVATGTLGLVGWNAVGGWRLWLEDAAGNRFYYAHLAAYSRWILQHRHVRRGQVIGFLGRTGDAFTTQPHLHFEVHPHQLSKLGYDGAVDPSGYLRTWRIARPRAGAIPRPATLRAPRGAPREEAAVVWRQLLAARHTRVVPTAARVLPPHALPKDTGPSRVETASGPETLAAPVIGAARASGPGRSGGAWGLLALAAVVGAGIPAALLSRRLRPRS